MICKIKRARGWTPHQHQSAQLVVGLRLIYPDVSLKKIRESVAFTLGNYVPALFVVAVLKREGLCPYAWHRVKDRWGKVSEDEIAEILGCTVGTVSTYRRTHGLEHYQKKVRRRKRPQPEVPQKVVQAILQAYQDGLSVADIKKRWPRYSGERISKIIRNGLNLDRLDPHRYGLYIC